MALRFDRRWSYRFRHGLPAHTRDLIVLCNIPNQSSCLPICLATGNYWRWDIWYWELWVRTRSEVEDGGGSINFGPWSETSGMYLDGLFAQYSSVYCLGSARFEHLWTCEWAPLRCWICRTYWHARSQFAIALHRHNGQSNLYAGRSCEYSPKNVVK